MTATDFAVELESTNLPFKNQGRQLREELRRFGTSFMRWWHGEDSPVASDSMSRADGAADSSPAGRDRNFSIGVAETMWGDGFTFPGSVDLTLELVKPLALTEKKSMLDLGCALGAGSRAIHKAYGTWMTGMEPSPARAAAGMELSRRKGQERSAPVKPVDLAAPNFPARRFDAVLSRLVLSRVANVSEFLDRVIESIRPHGTIVMFDFATTGRCSDSPRLQAWRAAEGCASQPLKLRELAGMLGGSGLDVRVAEDVTARFLPRITEGLANLAGQLDGRVVNSDELVDLGREIDLWGKRLAALKSGDLGLVRILGIAPTNLGPKHAVPATVH